MTFKKHNWIRYGRTGDIVKIQICDSTGRLIDRFQCNDKKDYRRILKILKDSYGFSPETDIEDSPNYDDEMQWLKKYQEDKKKNIKEHQWLD